MLTRVFGGAICFLSFVVLTVNTFLFLNSSAHFDYNSGVVSMAQAGVFYPYFVGFITMTIGILLVNDKVLESESHH
jgi:hypothetical protein